MNDISANREAIKKKNLRDSFTSYDQQDNDIRFKVNDRRKPIDDT